MLSPGVEPAAGEVHSGFYIWALSGIHEAIPFEVSTESLLQAGDGWDMQWQHMAWVGVGKGLTDKFPPRH